MEYLTIFTNKKSKALLLALTNTEKHFWGGWEYWDTFWKCFTETENPSVSKIDESIREYYKYEQVAPINLVKWSD